MERVPLTRDLANPTANQFTVSFASQRPASDYTLRIVPSHPQIFVPQEVSRILWAPKALAKDSDSVQTELDQLIAAEL